MYRISASAFAVFEHEAETKFIARLGDALCNAVPELRSEPPAAFAAQLRLLVEQARGHGLASEQTIGTYAMTTALLGVDFQDRFPGARQILESHEPEGRKAELLESFTMNLLETLEDRL